MRKLPRLFRLANVRTILIMLALTGITAEILYALKSPAINLLPPHLEGEWIRSNDPVDLHPHNTPIDVTIFRKKFSVLHPQQDLDVTVTAFRHLKAISIDGNPLPFSSPSSWKDPIHIVLPGRLLSPGPHVLRLTVVNRLAPSLIHVASTLHGLGNVQGWEESTFEGIEWRPALRADEQRTPAIKDSFPSVPGALRVSFPYFLPLIIGLFILSTWKPGFCDRIIAPKSVRLLLLAFITILGVNNLLKLGATVTQTGFDTREHLSYISYLL